jgi:signal transduction histidine kinase/ligand-binding sensor domain-containing protein
VKIQLTACVNLFLLVWSLFAGSVGTAAVVSSSDDYVAQAWDADSGLPHNAVKSIVQTPDGYLWVGTLHGGLARFDGLRFVNFHPGNTPELKSIQIIELLVDGGGTLWIGGVDGSLASYRDGKFRLEFENPQTPATLLNTVVSSKSNSLVLSSYAGWLFHGTNINGTNLWETIAPPADLLGQPYEDRDGVIWYRTSNRHLAQMRGKTVTRMDNPPGLGSPQVNLLFKDGTGRIWASTEKELAVWNGNRFVNMTPTNGEPEVAARDVAICDDGAFWVRTDNKLRCCANRNWLTAAQAWDGQFQPSTRSLEMFGDRQGGVWVRNYGDGLWHVDRSGHVSRVGIPQGLPNTLIECWCEDREGNLWVGLTDGGLACIRRRIFHPVWPAEEVQNKSTRSVCEDAEGAMWFGSAGQKVLRWRDGGFTAYTPPEQPMAGFETSVLPAGPGRLWVGTARNGLWLLENGVFKRPFPSDDIGTVVRCLYLDRTGALWIGNEFGLYRWDKGILKKFLPADGFSAAYVLSIAEDPTGDIWLGTAAGELRRWHAGTFTSFRPRDSLGGTNVLRSETEADSMPSRGRGTIFGRERFWALHFDNDGGLWIGTLGGGLLRFNEGVFTRFTTRDGLPNEHVSQILEDDQNQLWLGTRAGIVRVAKSDLTNLAKGSPGLVNFITYGKIDGLPTLACSGGIQPGCWKGRDGRLWFSTVKGPVWVNPSALRFNHLPPPVQLEEVLVDGERITVDSASPAQPGGRLPDPMRIAAGRHHCEFKFTALNFTSPDEVRFKWRMTGLEKDWGSESRQRSVTYSFVPPGNYEFQVRACNNDRVWNASCAAIKFTVEPYFWQTRWFPMMMTLVLVVGTALSVALVLRARNRRRLARLEVLRATELERSRIARDLHDELGSGLTEVTMLTATIPGANFSPDKLHKRLQRVGDRAHEMVDALDEIVWAVDPDKDNLPALARYFIGYVEEYLNESNIACMVYQPVMFPPKPISAKVRHQLFLAVREAVTNAVRHAQPSQIRFAIELDGKRNLMIAITDNGCGFDPAIAIAGHGLANLRSRLDSLGGQCEIIAQPGCGTTVKLVVRLPE